VKLSLAAEQTQSQLLLQNLQVTPLFPRMSVGFPSEALKISFSKHVSLHHLRNNSVCDVYPSAYDFNLRRDERQNISPSKGVA
jgi:hypothetical protein